MRLLLKSAVVLLFVVSVSAQNHPMPGAQSDPPVICAGCPGTNTLGEANADKPTSPYDSPVKVHAGRFVDSSSTQTLQNKGMRTVRAGIVRTASGRIYLQLGSAIGAYTRGTFFSGKLQEPMVAVNTINTGSPYSGRDPYEKLARPDRFFYPEARDAGWNTPLADGAERLRDFDVDDRGYVYLATLIFGWGIVSDPDGTSGLLLPSVVQVGPASFDRILSLRLGSTYYACLTGTSDSALFDVTTPATPAFVRSPGTFTQWTKYEAGQRVALRNQDGHVRVYTYADLIAGNAALADITPSASRQFADLSFDDDGNLWIAESGLSSNVVSNVLWKLTPSPNGGYTTTTYDVYGQVAFSPTTIHAAAGYIAVGGRVLDGTVRRYDLRLLRVTGGTPGLLDTDDFFLRYYAQAPGGYAQPSVFGSFLGGVRIVAEGGKTYLFYNMIGLGDVYELGDEHRITSMTPLSGIPAGGTNVSIYGTGFAAGSNVTFGGTAASSTFVSPTQMTAVSPFHASGAVDVIVSPPGAAPMTAPRKFSYVLNTPQSFVATATSTTTVGMSWSSVPGATQYEVSRHVPTGTWDVIGTPAATSFNDGARTAESTYVYRVRARDAAANFSDYSAPDLATTMSSESAVITAGMPILAVDLANLRMRVNAVRAAANLSALAFTGGGAGEPILAMQILEMQSAVQGARSALGFDTSVWPYSPIAAGTTTVKASHLNEILDLMR
ncbi:MAG: IPT/TIG domain-containing protein [Thermoanaerobaculia bacterium]